MGALSMFMGRISTDEWQETLLVNKHPVKFKLDMGTDSNVLPVEIYKQINITGKLVTYQYYTNVFWGCPY